MIRWMHYRLLYLAISLLVIGVGVYSLAKWGLPIGVDFKGGTLTEYKFQKDISIEDVSAKIKSVGVAVSSIQKTNQSSYIFKLGSVNEDEKKKVTDLFHGIDDKAEELSFQTVGPSVGPELVRKTIYGLSLAAGGILLWVWLQFKSAKFGVSAVLAMVHDSLVTIGMYSLFGHLFGAEVDFLFVTALLTVLSFSVHDTIVVYDRIRETRKHTGLPVIQIANEALSETMVRSLNNSLTIIFMLLALVLMGGTTIRWFAATLLVGTISGTYSSPFVAVPILVTWEQVATYIRKKRSRTK